ncbi:MAG: transcriptional regulator [Candidatus Thorarchaeota archaeon]
MNSESLMEADILSALAGLIEKDRKTMVPARFSILVYLYFTQIVTFPVLQKKLGLTSGNLSSHLSKLEEMGLIRIAKRFVNLKPTTSVVLIKKGWEHVRDQMIRIYELVTMAVDKEPKQNHHIPEIAVRSHNTGDCFSSPPTTAEVDSIL